MVYSVAFGNGLIPLQYSNYNNIKGTLLQKGPLFYLNYYQPMKKNLLFVISLFVSIFCSAQSITITSPRYVALGNNNLTIQYSGAPVGSDAWAGVYASGRGPGNGDSYRWAYTNGESGTLSFDLTDWDAYYVVLFADGGYNEIARSEYVLACNDYNTKGETFEMTTSKAKYEENEEVVVSIKNAPAFSRDWIGIYEENQTPGMNGDESSSYAYINASDQTIVLNSESTLQTGVQPIKAGKYYVTYLLWDGYSEVFPRTYFEVAEKQGTGIESVSSIDTENAIYSISGQRMSKMLRGLNIVSGKTVLVK